MENELERYLKSTKYCDCANDALKAKASGITYDASSPREKALKIFNFIRDEILFNSTLKIFRKASTTLRDGTIDYCNKINLHIAFLRSVGIPARIRYSQIQKEFLKPFIPRFLFSHIPNPIGHPWCECYLDGKWISCEALLDKELFRGMKKENLISDRDIRSIDWDGRKDLILLTRWLVEYDDPIDSLDDLLRNELPKVGYPPKFFCYLFNWIAAFGSRRITNKFRKLK
ncbi:MAG: transglutaminase family protein [Candidatus Thorarchaeota archaeon]